MEYDMFILLALKMSSADNFANSLDLNLNYLKP